MADLIGAILGGVQADGNERLYAQKLEDVVRTPQSQLSGENRGMIETSNIILLHLDESYKARSARLERRTSPFLWGCDLHLDF